LVPIKKEPECISTNSIPKSLVYWDALARGTTKNMAMSAASGALKWLMGNILIRIGKSREKVKE
jgi:hypothetical protein